MIHLLLLLACRPDPGAPSYPDPGADTDDSGGGYLPGPDPYADGDARLSLGIFYEGEASETVLIDNDSAFFYIYESSFSVVPSDTFIEGFASDQVVVSRDTWWGGGIHWNEGRDLSAYTHMVVHLRSDDIADIEIGMRGTSEAKLAASAYGFTSDGEWHQLAIPLADFSGVNLGAVDIPLILAGTGHSAGSSLLIDDLYLEAR